MGELLRSQADVGETPQNPPERGPLVEKRIGQLIQLHPAPVEFDRGSDRPHRIVEKYREQPVTGVGPVSRAWRGTAVRVEPDGRCGQLRGSGHGLGR